jgi:SAM-dependent methyltransferase
MGVRELVPQPVLQRVPPGLKRELRRQLSRWRARDTARALRGARSRPPAFLGLDELEALQREYPPPATRQYIPEVLQAIGAERAAFLRSTADRHLPPGRLKSLEVGCLDGMVSTMLREASWSTAAIDMSTRGFDSRARSAGAWLMAMDVGKLGFPDGCFDLVFSYDAFEHLADPKAALEEIIRVTAPGGLIYLNFGPLYNSARGLHAYRSVSVPFCQFLFEPATLDAFCRRHNLPPIKYHQLNGWSLRQFRDLWRSCGRRLQRVHYNESWSAPGIELVHRYPACFGRAVSDLEELSVDHIEALFRVRP